MKTPKIVGELEHRAGRQLTLLLGAARKQYDRFMNTAEKASDKPAQRRYIRAAEQTIDQAEKIIVQLRKRIAAAQKSLSGGARKKRKVTVKTRVKSAVKKRKKKQ
jgi:hypothetical protein